MKKIFLTFLCIPCVILACTTEPDTQDNQINPQELTQNEQAETPEDVQVLEHIENDEKMWRSKVTEDQRSQSRETQMLAEIGDEFLSEKFSDVVEDLKCSQHYCLIELTLSRPIVQAHQMKKFLRQGLVRKGTDWYRTASLPIKGSDSHVLVAIEFKRTGESQ